jgi:hypothetical protein
MSNVSTTALRAVSVAWHINLNNLDCLQLPVVT